MQTVTHQARTDDIQSFDRRSSAYEGWYLQGLLFDRVHRAALDLIPPEFCPETVLDVGCGTGRLLRKAAARWPAAQLAGVDPAEGMVNEARRLTPNAAFYVGTAEALPLMDSSVDLVLTTVSFHHWGDQYQGVRQVTRVLRPGGYFLLADVLMLYIVWKLTHHGRLTSPTAVRDMFTQAGLNLLTQRRVIFGHVLLTLGQGR
jgi:ubiquinone/menaquinone biosynthesis C-methylase UbiE